MTKWNKTGYDCPHCDNLLHIYTDKKGNVRQIRKGEDTMVKKCPVCD